MSGAPFSRRFRLANIELKSLGLPPAAAEKYVQEKPQGKRGEKLRGPARGHRAGYATHHERR
jgi:hypothetical protein